ncbi:hypothetical protein NPIL_346941 [Nephila pilipes]|uniref:Uncharacterized protein n=1 Tax=Nephila pilipes TaxID=299642 RepID=A0A8X6PWC1_NEPPI|nr:hypothetical protein NPIL_346941 [Nephila pilipes]
MCSRVGISIPNAINPRVGTSAMNAQAHSGFITNKPSLCGSYHRPLCLLVAHHFFCALLMRRQIWMNIIPVDSTVFNHLDFCLLANSISVVGRAA